jgi:hypothetical protein
MIGPAAIPSQTEYLADSDHGLWARVAAGNSLAEIGKRHPEARDECVAALTRSLEAFADQDSTLNSFVIGYLVDLKATEAAPVMERAFAVGRVDISIMGDWEDVQIALGLLAERLTPKPSYFWGQGLLDLEPSRRPPPAYDEKPAGPRRTGRRRRAKRKAKRKQQKRARRRQRKRK